MVRHHHADGRLDLLGGGALEGAIHGRACDGAVHDVVNLAKGSARQHAGSSSSAAERCMAGKLRYQCQGGGDARTL